MLTSLEFKVESAQDRRPTRSNRRRSAVIGHRSSVLRVTVPDHRLDVDGTDDLVEEIARMYGYENIPISRMNDELPPQRENLDVELEERARDVLIDAGLQDVVTYRFTTPEREALLTPPGATRPAIPAREYVRIENAISADRSVLRQSLHLQSPRPHRRESALSSARRGVRNRSGLLASRRGRYALVA
jgi:phenylalanyl-tRNA synthetase beta subunit